MTKKDVFLVTLAAILGGLYVCYFTDWFRPKFIRIEHTMRPLREAWGPGGRVDPAGKQDNNVTFSLDKDYRLTSVQVVPATEAQTNTYPHPLWHLVCKTGSPPVNAISYGQPISGMTPSVRDNVAEALEPGIPYCLLVQAGSIKGTNYFYIPEKSPAGR